MIVESPQIRKSPLDSHIKLKQLGFISYEDYLKSDKWISRRNEYFFKSLDKKCYLCSVTKNLDVHHITYDNLTEEKDEDLILICRFHHDLIHAVCKFKKIRLDYAHIYLNKTRTVDGQFSQEFLDLVDNYRSSKISNTSVFIKKSKNKLNSRKTKRTSRKSRKLKNRINGCLSNKKGILRKIEVLKNKYNICIESEKDQIIEQIKKCEKDLTQVKEKYDSLCKLLLPDKDLIVKLNKVELSRRSSKNSNSRISSKIQKKLDKCLSHGKDLTLILKNIKKYDESDFVKHRINIYTKSLEFAKQEFERNISLFGLNNNISLFGLGANLCFEQLLVHTKLEPKIFFCLNCNKPRLEGGDYYNCRCCYLKNKINVSQDDFNKPKTYKKLSKKDLRKINKKSNKQIITHDQHQKYKEYFQKNSFKYNTLIYKELDFCAIKAGYSSYKEYRKSEDWKITEKMFLDKHTKCSECDSEIVNVYHIIPDRIPIEREQDLKTCCYTHAPNN